MKCFYNKRAPHSPDRRRNPARCSCSEKLRFMGIGTHVTDWTAQNRESPHNKQHVNRQPQARTMKQSPTNIHQRRATHELDLKGTACMTRMPRHSTLQANLGDRLLASHNKQKPSTQDGLQGGAELRRLGTDRGSPVPIRGKRFPI